MRALLAGWGASVLPELLVRPWLDSGQLVDLAPETRVPVALYWHCWNLDSPLLDRLTHKSHIVMSDSNSYRLKESLKKKPPAKMDKE